MRLNEVMEVLDCLDAVGVRHWMAGGWGVDALVGHETRFHRDLDLAVDAADLDVCLAALLGLGYEVETDWLPLRIECAAHQNRWVDVHPVAFDSTGGGVLGDPMGTHFIYPANAFAEGSLGARTVRCLSVGQQQLFHSGYTLRPQDEHDLRQLQRLSTKL